MVDASHWRRLGLASVLMLASDLPARSAEEEALATATEVEVANFPKEQDVRVTNLAELDKSFVVSVAVRTDRPERDVTVLTVPADQVLILTDAQFGAVQDTGYRLEDNDSPQLYFRVASGQALHYQTGVVFGPGEKLRVKRSDGEPLHPFEATFMGRLVPTS